MVINHNLGSMNALRNSNVNSSNASKSMEKLSSGLRINRAGDDAAGLAISEKMRAQVRGLDQASANAQDGISMIQTAEGGLSETHSILQRMRELAVQAANDTNVSVDRGEIQKEMDELTKEVTRISNNTEFNTQKLINGGISDSGIGSAKFHIGANAAQDITLSINAMDAKSLGITRDVKTGIIDADHNSSKLGSVSADSVDVEKTLDDGKYRVNLTSQAAGATSATNASGTAVTGLVSGTATADTNITLTYTDHGTAATNAAAAAVGTSVAINTASSLKINGTTVNLNSVKNLGTTGYDAQTNEADVVSALQSDINAALGSGKYTVSVDSAHKMSITSVATGSATKVDLTGSDSTTASLLGFTGSLTGTAGAATGGVKDWVAAGSLGGVVSGANNTVNGITIDQTKLSSTAAVGDTITVKGFKDATLSAQLQSVSSTLTPTTTPTGATVGAGAVTGTPTKATNITLTASAVSAGTASKVTGASNDAPTTDLSTKDVTMNIRVNGVDYKINKATLNASLTGAGKTETDLINLIKNADTVGDGTGTKLSSVANVTAASSKISIEETSASGTAVTVTYGGTDKADAATAFGMADNLTNTGTAASVTWTASGDATGVKAGSFTTNGITVDTTKLSAAANGNTVVIGTAETTVTSNVGSNVTVDQKNGGSYVIGDSAGAGQMKIGIKAGTAVAGSTTVNLTTNVATAATKQADGTMSNATAVGGLDVSTQSKASASVTTLQRAIETVSAERSKLGAYQNRLEHTIANLGTSSENLSSAESRIRDVDMAKEMSTYSKNNILAQAAQSMLAQANQQPQQVLKLLQ